eukprot:TRINITY_DN93222_c0_g1_i1.p1 TRINITY_DN93222_c0_g1~~TRINITY_DN93222_c0_g1_i1.p1  ORF type:complete len:195 (-),score=21.04 TRINITY_DN93222_c0_g1_i1:191-775(-)
MADPNVLGDCSICLEPISAKHTRSVMDGSCTHIFHWECMKQQLARNPTCPNCRAAISSVWLTLPDGSATRYTVKDAEVDFHRAEGFSTLLQVQVTHSVCRGDQIEFMLPNSGRLRVPVPRDLAPGQAFHVQLPPELRSPLQPWPVGEWYHCEHCATSLYLAKGARQFECTHCGRQSKHTKGFMSIIKNMMDDLL